MKWQAWISAARPRTLPLAALGPATVWALLHDQVQNTAHFPLKIVLLFATAVFLQILSNFANDYGDFTKGTDNLQRIGPERALQSGKLKATDMLRAIWVSGLLALASGLTLIGFLWKSTGIGFMLLLFLAGLAAIWAAISYTVGEKPYGYTGFGDLAVFIFFGWVSVIGSAFVLTPTPPVQVYWLANALGLCSVSVLHMNNMRDVENDKNSGKITLAIRLGDAGGKIYHVLIMALASISWMLALPQGADLRMMLPGCLLAMIHALIGVRIKQRKTYDALLKFAVFTTLLLGIGYILAVPGA